METFPSPTVVMTVLPPSARHLKSAAWVSRESAPMPTSASVQPPLARLGAHRLPESGQTIIFLSCWSERGLLRRSRRFQSFLSAWLGERFSWHRHARKCAAPRRRASSDLEWRIRRNSLHVESETDLCAAQRIRSHVPSSSQFRSLRPRQSRCVFVWCPLVPNHV